MKKLRMKRLLAYLIDIFVVSMLITLISEINVINPNKDKYLKTYNEYKVYVEKTLDGGVITTDDILTKEYSKFMYDLQYYAIGNTIAECVVLIAYFTLFPRYNNNQTIGKRICKIKVVHKEENKKVTVWHFFARSLLMPIAANIIFYTVITSLLNVGVLYLFSGIKYLYANMIITYLINFYCYIDLLFIFVRKDHASLHDLLTKTKVEEIC